MFQADLLQGNQVVGQLAATFVHRGVGPLQTDRWCSEDPDESVPKHSDSVCELTSPSLSSLMYVSSFPNPISDCTQRETR